MPCKYRAVSVSKKFNENLHYRKIYPTKNAFSMLLRNIHLVVSGQKSSFSALKR